MREFDIAQLTYVLVRSTSLLFICAMNSAAEIQHLRKMHLAHHIFKLARIQ